MADESRAKRKPPVRPSFLLWMCAGVGVLYAGYTAYVLNHPLRGLASNASSVRAEMLDIERTLSRHIVDKGTLPFDVPTSGQPRSRPKARPDNSFPGAVEASARRATDASRALGDL